MFLFVDLTSADPGVGLSPLGPISFIFMQCAANILPNNRLVRLLLELLHPLLEILDPPLSITCIIFPLSRLLELGRHCDTDSQENILTSDKLLLHLEINVRHINL